MSDLTLPGTIPGLIRNGTPLMVQGFYTRWPALSMGFSETMGTGNREWLHVAIHGMPNRIGLVEIGKADVDLTDATGRAHAAWWLAAELGWGMSRPEWCYDADNESWRLLGSYGCSVWADDAGWGDLLSPLWDLCNGDRRLPDGSRWVDAEALRRVVLHVAGVPA